ncbi:MAG TPA: FlgO family outer membrane protein [Bacillota bacterium]|nr:FlgO family outer membrane protein [Bacillota bacterium]
MKSYKILLLLLVFLSLPLPCFAAADPLDTTMDNLTSQIVTGASKTMGDEKMRVAVIEFSDLQGNVPDLGKYIAEELTTRLVLTNQFEVVERTLLNKVMAEHKLSLSGLIDVNSAKEIGKILGVAAIISGTITDLGDNVKVNARLINTETGSIAAVASVQLKKNQAIQKLLVVNNNINQDPSIPPVIVPPIIVLEPTSAPKAESKSPEEIKKEEYAKLIDLGCKYRSQDLSDKALATFKKAVEMDPTQESAYQNLIEIYLTKRDYSQALSWCQKAVAAIDDFAYAYAAMGYCYLYSKPKNMNKAVEALNTALVMTEYPDPEGWTYYVLGMVNQEKGLFSEAKTFLEKALNRCRELNINPDWSSDCKVLLQDVNTKLSKKAEDEKKAAYAQLIDLGVQYWSQDLLDQAIATFQKAIALDPKQEKAYQHLIEIYLKKPDYQQALSWCQKGAAEVDQFAYTYAAMGYCYLNSRPKNINKAIEALNTAIAMNEYPGGNGWAYYILGRAYLDQGQSDQARLYFEKALKKYSSEWYQDCINLLEPILNDLILQNLKNQDYHQALSISQEAVASLNNYAWGYVVIGFLAMSIIPYQPDNALTALKKAIAITDFPDNEGWAYYILGMVHQEKGEFLEAKDSFNKALSRCRELNIKPDWFGVCSSKLIEIYPELIKKAIESKSPDLLTLCQEAIEKLNLAYAYAGIGYYYLQTNPQDLDQAIEYLHKAVAISEYPDNEGWTYYLLGWAYYEKGNKEEAKTALEKAIARYQSVQQPSPMASAWYHKSLQMMDRLNQTNKICLSAGLGAYTQPNGIGESVSLVEVHYGSELPMKFSRGLVVGVGFADHVFLIKAGAEGAFELPAGAGANLSWSIPVGLGYYSATETIISYDYGTDTTITNNQTNSGFYYSIGAGLKYYLNKQQGIRLSAGLDYFSGPNNFDPFTFRVSLIIPLANN